VPESVTVTVALNPLVVLPEIAAIGNLAFTVEARAGVGPGLVVSLERIARKPA